jgi:hypothetical protein
MLGLRGLIGQQAAGGGPTVVLGTGTIMGMSAWKCL